MLSSTDGGEANDMAKLKTTFESQGDVPEALADFYVEKNGKYVLQVEGINSIEAIESTLKSERGQRSEAEKRAKEAEAKMAKLGDKDVDDVLKQLDEIEELRARAEGGKDEAAIEKLVQLRMARDLNPLKRERDQLQSQLAEATAKAEALDSSIKTSKIDSAIGTNAQKAGVIGEAVDDVMNYRHLFEVAPDGAVVTRDGVGVTPGIGVDSWMADMKDKRPHWFPPAVGGGARGNNGAASGGNPFAKGKFNLAEVSRIMKESPDKAQSLAQQAGFASPIEATKAAARDTGK